MLASLAYRFVLIFKFPIFLRSGRQGRHFEKKRMRLFLNVQNPIPPAPLTRVPANCLPSLPSRLSFCNPSHFPRAATWRAWRLPPLPPRNAARFAPLPGPEASAFLSCLPSISHRRGVREGVTCHQAASRDHHCDHRAVRRAAPRPRSNRPSAGSRDRSTARRSCFWKSQASWPFAANGG